MSISSKIIISAFYISLFVQNFLLSFNPVVVAIAWQAASVGIPFLGGIALGIGSGIFEDNLGFKGQRDESLFNQYMHRIFHISTVSSIGLIAWKVARLSTVPSDIAFSSALMAIHSFAYGRYMWDEGDRPNNEPAQEMYLKFKQIPGLVAAFLIINRVPGLKKHAKDLQLVGAIGSALTLCALNT